MLVPMIAALAMHAAAGTTPVYGLSHEVISPRDLAASARNLKTALQRFERDLAAKRGSSKARKPKEIVVVGSKVKDSQRTIIGGFKSVSGMDSDIDIVEYRDGGPASLPKLQAAIGRFERTAGQRSPCVGRCRATERRCLARCRRALGKTKIRGRCVCDHIRARCLIRAARQGTCHPPEPGRPRRR